MQGSTYDELRLGMAAALRWEADAADAGRSQAIGERYDDFDEALPRDEGREFDKLFVALHFWDAWLDERNHGWPNFYGIARGDWSRLARGVADDLDADRDVSDSLVVAHFRLEPPRPPGRVRRWLARVFGS